MIGKISEQETLASELLVIRTKDKKTLTDFDKRTDFQNIRTAFFSTKEAFEKNTSEIASAKSAIQSYIDLIKENTAARELAVTNIEDSEIRILELTKLISDELDPAISAVDNRVSSFEVAIEKIKQDRTLNKSIRAFVLDQKLNIEN